MKNALRIFIGDLRHLMNNTIAAIVVVGLVLIPPMYAWFTSLGFWDPYSNTGNLKVAVANEDAGYKSDLLPIRINAGDQVVGRLRANDQFNWQFVTAEQAEDRVRSGEYYAAIVIPESFSADLMTVFSDDIQHTQIEYFINEKENAIAPKITDTGATTLAGEIDKAFTQTVADVALDMTSSLTDYMTGDSVSAYAVTLEEQIADTASMLDNAAQQADSYAALVSSAGTLLSDASSLLADLGKNSGNFTEMATSAQDRLAAAREELAKVEVVADLDGVINKLNNLLGDIPGGETQTPDSLAALADGSDAAPDDPELPALDSDIDLPSPESLNAAARKKIQSAIDALENVKSGYQDKIEPAVERLDGLIDTALEDAAQMQDTLEGATGKLSDSASSAASRMSGIESSINEAASVLRAAALGLNDTDVKLREAISSNDVNEIKRIIGSNPEAVAAFFSAPTELVRHPVWEMPNNGSAMSPFYTSLSLWIGSIFLVALVGVNVSERRQRQLDNPRPWQLYLGRYAIFALLAVAQALVVCLGNVFFLGVHCEHFWLYLLACVMTAIVFSNVIYTLTISFGNIGKAIAIILLVMQLAGSGGIFPVQMSAEFFQVIYPWLPFSHSMEAFESAMAGIYGMQYWESIGLLAALLIPSLLLGLLLRTPVIKMNAAINRKLDETHLI